MLLHQHSSQCPSQLNHLASFPQAESSDLIGLSPNSTLHTAGHTAKACWDIWTSLESSTAYWYSFYGCFSFFFFFFEVTLCITHYKIMICFPLSSHSFIHLFVYFLSSFLASVSLCAGEQLRWGMMNWSITAQSSVIKSWCYARDAV